MLANKRTNDEQTSEAPIPFYANTLARPARPTIWPRKNAKIITQLQAKAKLPKRENSNVEVLQASLLRLENNTYIYI